MERRLKWLSILCLVAASSLFPCQGNTLNEVWLSTVDAGNVDAIFNSDVYLYYTSLSDVQLDPAADQQISFRVKACEHAFILLSASYDLNSPDYYEILLGGLANLETYIRRDGATIFTQHKISTIGILSCSEYRYFTITWSTSGTITIYGASNQLTSWKDSTPLNIKGVGIMTGWGHDGTWAISHNAVYKGYFCGSPGKYGSMNVLQTKQQSTVLSCTALCGLDNECLGFNYNEQTEECLTLANGLLLTFPLSDWKFFTKCLQDQTVCLTCLI